MSTTAPTAPFVHVWRVEGLRHLPDGGTLSVLGTAYGTTEERARSSFKRWSAVTDERAAECGDEPTRWQDHELTFTREETRHAAHH